MEHLAPIVLFVYNRPEHASETLRHLCACNLAERSQLYVFSDGPKPDDTSGQVDRVRELLSDVRGFKGVQVFRNEHNLGLAASVIGGLNRVFGMHESAIVLEDDMLLGRHCLEYMNEALQKYAADQRVYSVSAYAYDLPLKRARGSYFLPTSSNQTWGTWRAIWQSVDFDPGDYGRLAKDPVMRFRFNEFGGIDYSSRLIEEGALERSRSWAIRFRWDQFKHDGLTLFPSRNLVRNIGWDGTGTNCATENPYQEDVSHLGHRETSFPEKVRFLWRDRLRLILFFFKIRASEYIRVRVRGRSLPPSGQERGGYG